MGRYQIVDPYKTFPENGYYSTGTYGMLPTRNLNSKDTYYHMYIQESQNANTYVIAEWILTDATYGDIG